LRDHSSQCDPTHPGIYGLSCVTRTIVETLHLGTVDVLGIAALALGAACNTGQQGLVASEGYD